MQFSADQYSKVHCVELKWNVLQYSAMEYVTIDEQSSAMFGWSWTDASVLGSHVFGQAFMDSCERGE